MTAATISFYASSAIALLAGLAAVLVRRSDRALAGFAVAFAAMLVPVLQLQATAVAAVMLLATAISVVLLGVVATGDKPDGQVGRPSLAYWLPAGLGLLGFCWVMLATGSRQVVDLGDPVPRGSRFGDASALLLDLGTEFVIPALLVALLALCAVIAAVLGLVGKAS